MEKLKYEQIDLNDNSIELFELSLWYYPNIGIV